MDSRVEEFREAAKTRFPQLSDVALAKSADFYRIVLEQNEVQNLTRLISPTDFIEGHLVDVVELARSGMIEGVALDLGSGAGVPGLLFAACYGGEWVLTDSENRKAEFLRATVRELGLLNVSVDAGRAEAVLSSRRVDVVVARAVGPVERIHGWLRNCSTWNNLVLMKGPKWEEEWLDFSRGRYRRELVIEKEHRYQVRPDHGVRVIVKIGRRS